MNKTVVFAVVAVLAVGAILRQAGCGSSPIEGRRRILGEHEVYARLAAERVSAGDLVVMLVPAPPTSDKTLSALVSLYRKPLLARHANIEVHAISDNPALAVVTEPQFASAVQAHPDAAFLLLFARVDAELAAQVRAWSPGVRLMYALQQTVDAAPDLQRLVERGIIDLVAVLRPPAGAPATRDAASRFAQRYEVLSAPPRPAP
ncbi:MAG TPA: hypothetical protein PKE12_11915 [Kiritimatiellia bacterium]|nr:hypothetical protein [Kiritimatiellia bacterium]